MTVDELKAAYGVCSVCGTTRVPVMADAKTIDGKASLAGRLACQHRPIQPYESRADDKPRPSLPYA